jgi:protein-disulfide isomerase
MSSRFLFVATALLLVVVFGVAVYVEQGGRSPPAAPAAPTISDRPTAGVGTQLVRAHSPALGRADAPVTLVEFVDPACETCALFYPEVKKLLAANPDKLRLVMRHVPFHPGSEGVVALLEAAKAQGKYWEALEALLRQQDRWVHNHRVNADDALAVLGAAGFDVARLKADAGSPQAKEAAAQDLADAKALKVTKTPEYFVNGQPLPRFGLEELKSMVAQAIRAS